MIHFRCGQCSGWIGAADADAGRTVTCRTCGRDSLCPTRVVQRATVRQPSPRGRPLKPWLLGAAAIAVLCAVAGRLAATIAGGGPEPSTGPLTPVQQRQQELLAENVGHSGDADLMAQFMTINTRHFNGALPIIPVRWEPKLAEVGTLAAEAFTLEGLFGRLGRAVLILINPDLRDDPYALDRALCHEMVHFYLFTNGDTATNHGPPFKTVLARLSREGAFQGVAGTEEEKAALRAWLDAESTRLDMDQTELERIGQDITHEREAVEEQASALNRRIAQGAQPESSEIAAVEQRRQRFNEIVLETNARIEQGRTALARFNAEVARYNLMLVYPDGMDEGEKMAPRVQGR